MKILSALLALGITSLACASAVDAGERRAKLKGSSLSPRLGEAVDLGLAPATDPQDVVVALEPRNRDALEAFLREVQDPASPRYRKFLTQEQFNALYAPTQAEEMAVVAHLTANGFKVKDRHGNRLLVGASGTVATAEQAFGVKIHDVHLKGKRHRAAVNDPTLPASMARYVTGVLGLDDLGEMRPRIMDNQALVLQANATVGNGTIAMGPKDLSTFYDNVTGYNGYRQVIVIAGAYMWNSTDVSVFAKQFGLLSLSSSQVCTGVRGAPGCLYHSTNSLEVSLDVEYAHAAAPGAKIYNYMAGSTSFADFTTMYNKIVTAKPGMVVTTSWGACEATMPVAIQQADDNIFANANAIGQAWFAASGDRGSRDCGDLPSVDFPASSPHVIGVGGTVPTCSSGMTSLSPACGGYGSEAAWSGSGGGVSQVFARPAFQTGCGIPAGSQRLVPDVALDASPSPGKYVRKGGLWFIVGGTSGAAPEWAGFFAQLMQKKGTTGGLGNPGPRLYALCGTPAFHDITMGSNGDYSAAVGHDPVTGLGSIEAKNFVASFLCTGTACATSCTTDSQCVPGWSCSAGVCVPLKKPNGQACSAASECQSGSCADGVCCNTACTGACQACSLPGSVGTCVPVAAGTLDAQCDPYVCSGAASCFSSCTGDGDCTPDAHCASGVCKPKEPIGSACTGQGECASGFCADGVCCNTACTGDNESCDLSPGTCLYTGCSPYLWDDASGACFTSCTTDSQCSAGAFCSGGACQ